MKAYKGHFRKADGSIREMNFIELVDLPEDFLKSLFKGQRSKPNKIQEGSRYVYDIDMKAVRIFNGSTQIGSLEELDDVVMHQEMEEENEV